MAIKTITVSTAAQLSDALSKATGGETILLNSGNYGKLSLTTQTKFDYTYASEVTIRSADANRPAVFTGLDVRKAENITFENLTFDYTWSKGQRVTTAPFGVQDSHNITIRGSTFDGDTAKGGDAAGIGYAAGRAFSGFRNTDFDFIDNTVHTFWKGVLIAESDNVRVTGNEFYALRSDGLNVGVPKGILIEDNYFHNFELAPSSGDHSDFIQFSTTNATRPGTDITIRGNLFDVGDGGAGTHTIFIRNDQVDTGLAGSEMFFRNVLIEQNTIYNDHLHGITVGETAGLVIRNNTVLHADGGLAGGTGQIEVPRITVASGSTNVTIVDNIVGNIGGGLQGYETLPGGWTVSNNLLVQDDDRSAPNHYSTLFVSSSYDDGAVAGVGGRHYIALPGGLIEMMGVGADATLLDRTPATLAPLFHVGVQSADESSFVFDAANFSFGPQGLAAADAATFLWTFGDGSTATGGVVTHRYAAPGSYAVTLDIVMPDGSRAAVTDTVQKLGADLLRFDSTTGKFAVSDGFSETMINISAGALAGSGAARTLDLDVASKAVVNAKAIEGLFGADNFTLNLQLKADVTPDSSGNVLRLQNTLTGSVDRNGNFTFTLNTDDGQKTTVTSKGAALLDGQVHDVRIVFDADLGALSIAVDDKPAVSAAVTGNLPPMGAWDLTFGKPPSPSGASFDGKLLKLDLDVDRSIYEAYDAVTPAAMSKASVAFMDEPQGAAVVFDDYLLDGMAMKGLAAAALRGDAHLVREEGHTLLSFDGKGDSVVLGKLAQFQDSATLAVQVDFQRDAGGDRAGTLFSNADQIRLDVVDDGFRLRVATADAGMKTYNIGKLGLNDTDRHQAVVIVDAVADRLQVFLDDRLAFEDRGIDLVMTNPEGGHNGGWRLGAGFDGQIADLRIDDDIGHQIATGDVVAFA